MKTVLTITAITLAANSHAAMIFGDINFSGGATFDTNNFEIVTEILSWDSTTVQQAGGDFQDQGIVNGSIATFAAGWTLDQGQNDFWQTNGFSFDLQSTQVTKTQNFIIIQGQGIVSGNGFDPTPFQLNFSSQPTTDPNNRFSFSAATNSQAAAVPEPSTAGLLLAGVIGLAARRRR